MYRTLDAYLVAIVVHACVQAPTADPEKTKAGVKRSSMNQKNNNMSKKSKVTNN
eukprot:COSAG02_NODE_23629_length_712_cov_1.210440_2_plen_53_part_01